jgi:hypothetical protein
MLAGTREDAQSEDAQSVVIKTFQLGVLPDLSQTAGRRFLCTAYPDPFNP